MNTTDAQTKNMRVRTRKKTIIGNALSLFSVQFANYLLPLITFPYLVHVLGVEKFGLLSFVFSLIQYFVIITDYGFNYTATRQVSIYRDNKDKLSSIFWTVMIIKLCLLIVSLAFLMGIIYWIPKFNSDRALYLISATALIGGVLFPVWYFQGTERIVVMSIVNLLSKVILTVFLFIYIKSPKDINAAAFIMAAGPLFSGVILFLVAVSSGGMSFFTPKWQDIKESLRDGWAVFINQISSALLNNSNVFILGLFVPPTMVGYYAIADKIVRAVINLVGPISTSIFPFTSQLFNQAVKEGELFVRRIIRPGTIVFGVLSLSLFIFADFLTKIISGQPSQLITLYIRIMAIAPFTIFIDNMYGVQVLLNIGRKNAFMWAVLLPGVLSVALSFLFVPKYGGLATALIFVLSELLVLTLMIIAVRSHHICLYADKLF